jgi:hypothetical protein
MPSHSQILISGQWFPDDEPCVITGISFYGSLIAPTCSAEIVLSMGLLDETRALAGSGLSEDFESNVAYSTIRPLFIETNRSGQFEFPVTKRIEQVYGVYSREQPWQTFEIPFLSPFDYPGRRQDLVLDIRNLSGVSNPVQSSGIDLVASVQTRRPNSLLLGELGASSGLCDGVSLTMVLRAQRYLEVISRWYVVKDMEAPQFRDAGWKGDGIRDHHFTVTWQAGEPTLDAQGNALLYPDGTPICQPAQKEYWSMIPPTKGGRAVRAKITFHAAALARAERLPEIEYLLLTYRESKNH